MSDYRDYSTAELKALHDYAQAQMSKYIFRDFDKRDYYDHITKVIDQELEKRLADFHKTTQA